MTNARAAALASLAALAIAGAARAEPKKNPACVKVSSEARARPVGYDHVVTITNSCERAAACVVSTDVAPDPIRATVDPKKTIELTTFRGSPARVFTPKVECSLP